jgi:peptidoglycan/LPS O-acetylase OafA/YrhL
LTKKLYHRFHAVDGLRGIAALAVVAYHCSRPLEAELADLFPTFVNTMLDYGFLGVPLFFVISGFVISLSVGNTFVSKSYAGNFILRRSVRLDPTYWASIAFAVTLLYMKYRLFDPTIELPSITDVLAHMFYLQELLQVEPKISVVYWTLCLEVQLYLFFLFTLWLSQKIAGTSFSRYYVHLFIICLAGLYSILLDVRILEIKVPGLFTPNWHYFLMGVLVSNVVRGLPHSPAILFGWIILEIGAQSVAYFRPYVMTGVLCSLLIYIFWKLDLLEKVFSGRVFQYLGRISYTLYLVHPDVGWNLISLSRHFLGNTLTPAMGGALFILAIIASIICAHFFHLMFERPSLRLCAALKSESLGSLLARTRLRLGVSTSA